MTIFGLGRPGGVKPPGIKLVQKAKVLYKNLNQRLVGTALDGYTYFQPPLKAADTYANYGRVAQAVSVLQQGLKRNPRDLEAHLKLGTLYYHQTDYARALDHFFAARSIDGTDIEASHNLGVTFYRQEELGHAQNAFCYLIDYIAPELKLPPQDLRLLISHLYLGKINLSLGQLDLAKKHFEFIGDADIDPPHNPGSVLDLHLFADSVFDLEYYAAQIVDYEHGKVSRETNLSPAEAFKEIGKKYRAKAQNFLAIFAFDTALSFAPDDVDILRQLLEVLMSNDYKELAVEKCRQFLARNPRNEEIRLALANLYRQQS